MPSSGHVNRLIIEKLDGPAVSVSTITEAKQKSVIGWVTKIYNLF
jgi:hypothetical protein